MLQSEAKVDITSVRIQNNHALSGGGLFIGDYASSTVRDIVFDSCYAATSGGALIVTGFAAPHFLNCTISNCIADSIGSGIITLAFSQPTFKHALLV